MNDQIHIYYLSWQNMAQELHGLLVAAGLLFLILIAVLWNYVANHFVQQRNLSKARKASALFCLLYSLLRAQTILRDGTNALLETTIHIYLLYHITYPLFLLIVIPTARLRVWLWAQWYRCLRPLLQCFGGFYVSSKQGLKQIFLDKLNAPKAEKSRKEYERLERKRIKLESIRKQLRYELNLQYQGLLTEVHEKLSPTVFGDLCHDALDTEDISTMEDRAQKLQDLLASFGSGTVSKSRANTSRIHEIGSEFSEQREQINKSSAYDQRQKDHLNTFLNRLEGVELENYLKEKIHGVSHKPRH